MTSLHVHFLRNQQAFQRLLADSADRGQSAPGLSTSGGRSWNKTSPLSSGIVFNDVNAKDQLGRTVLHLACSSVEPASAEYVRMLLAHPAINVNVVDSESRWTPLHRAFYNGNLTAALQLLQRPDIDTSLKDFEGYTAYDLYNSTVEGTKVPVSLNSMEAELLTWGVNRNAALGLGDGDDRAYPEQVVIPPLEGNLDVSLGNINARFMPIRARQFAMSKLHSAIVTSEPRNNLRLCGFSSGGRLGPGQHTQYSLKPLNQFSQTVVSVALGQDHTLALTKTGEVYSWGLNRFSQLGYVVELPSGSLEPIQSTPRKVQGALKKDMTVEGVAASRVASACWTKEEVFTWGTNNGQLGIEKVAQPAQILPRKVTKITQPVISIAMTDAAMACLLKTQEIELFWNERHFKINFPQAFPSEISVYRPPQFIKDANITKVTSCNDTFAALSSNGELFTFTVPNPSEAQAVKERTVVKPQRVWALRKQFSAVRDAALGADGSLIVCTESGHVFVRSRSIKAGTPTAGSSGAAPSSNKSFKFVRIPYVQRITRVYANSTGAFGALRIDHNPRPVKISGNTLEEDMASIEPWVHAPNLSTELTGLDSLENKVDGEEDDEDADIRKDTETLLKFCRVLSAEQESRRGPKKHGIFEKDKRLPLDADLLVQVGRAVIPVHRVVLAARSRILCDILTASYTVQEGKIKLQIQKAGVSESHPRLIVAGCHALTVLVLLSYLYTDDIIAVWDRRLSIMAGTYFSKLNIDPAEVRLETQKLSRLLQLPLFSSALESHAKRTPSPSLSQDMYLLFENSQKPSQLPPPLKPDVVLCLADKEVFVHSAVLRSRSAFFADLFGDGVWTANRWDAQGVIKIDLSHLEWRTMDYVLQFIYRGDHQDLFPTLDFVTTLDEVLEFVFNVLSAANELLLDRLILQCSTLLLRFLTVTNATYLLSEATHFNALQLVSSIQEYITINLELFMESHMLADLPPFLIKQLSTFVREAQAGKSPLTRSSVLVDMAMEKHADWLALQDIPHPIIKSARNASKKDPRLSPTTPVRQKPRLPSSPTVPPAVRTQRPIHHQPSADDIFAMDEMDVGAPSDPERMTSPNLTESSSKAAPGWKGIPSAPRADMKTIMAETSRTTQGPSTSGMKTPVIGRVSQKERFKAQSSSQQNGGASTNPVPSQPTRPSDSPWRLPSTPPQSSQMQTPASSSPTANITRAKDSLGTPNSPSRKPSTSSLGSGRSPNPTSGPTPVQSHLGPVFTPARQAQAGPSRPESLNIRRSSSGKAWSLPPLKPVVAPTSSTGISLVAIQQLQLDEAAPPIKERRSLKDIQEEEQSKREEAEFMLWWQQEEERVRLETEALTKRIGASTEGKKRKPRQPKNHPPAAQQSAPATSSKGDAPTRPSQNTGRGGGRKTSGRGREGKEKKPKEKEKEAAS